MARSHPRMVCTACVRHLYTIRDCESSAFLKHVTFLWESSQCRSSLCFSGLDLGCNENRLRAVPHFSSGIVERAKRERARKSPHARKGDTRRGREKWKISPPRVAFSRVGWFSRALEFACSTITEEKCGTTRSLQWEGHLRESQGGKVKCEEWYFLSLKLIPSRKLS